MAEMKDSGIEWIGDIPQNWKLKRIQFCLDEINEKNIPIKTEQVLSLVKDKGVMLYEDKGNQGNKAKEDVSQYKIAYPNTLIVNSMNILIGSVGISNYLGCVSPVYYVFKENEDSDLRYINYIFNTREFQKELRKYANGILEIRLRVSSSDIFKRKIPLPDKHIQTKIANFLDKKCAEIDTLHSDIEKQIETLEEYKKSIITEAVTKGLNPDVEMKDSGIEWIGMIPKHWNVMRTKYASENLSKGNGITKDEIKNDGNIQCIRYGEIYSKYDGSILKCFSKTKKELISSPKYISKGDILFAGTGELVEEIGKNVVYMGDGDCLAGGDIIVMKHNQNPVFFNYALNSTYSQAQKSKGKAKLKVVHISAADIGNIFVAIPPKKEQKKIAIILEKKCFEINCAINEKKEQLDTLEQYKKSLIYEYVTGKKEVLNG